MCGIAGIFEYHYASNPVDAAELVRIRDHMRARGPDGAGLWLSKDGHMGLAHRRLAIIDPDARSNQPMLSADGRYAISFNGEIYNYRALRAELASSGAVFRTQSDTEVLLQLFAREGAAMLPRLRGMFAFGIYDTQEQKLFLARDPYGIKPLYYADSGWTLHFASQVKALLSSARIARDPDPAGLVGFYLLGSVPEPYTLYRQIRALPAGTSLWVDALGAGEPRPYFSIARVWANAARPASAESGRGSAAMGGALATTGPDGHRGDGANAEAPNAPAASEAIRSALLESVRHHLEADVPVGAFLSAGIDSGALVGLMRDAGQTHIKTITLAFDEFRDAAEDESPLAAETAKRYNTDHHVYRVTQAEFEQDLPKLLDAMDQPSIDGINTWFVAKATAAHGLKVAISGLGGDELFGGYPSFRDVPRWVRGLRVPSRVPGLPRLFRAMAPKLRPRANPKIAGMLHYGGSYAGAWFLKRGLFMPWELNEILDPETLREGLRRLRLIPTLQALLQPDPGTPYGRVATLESAGYMRNQLLRDADWASMAHSLEIRVPLVDAQLLQQLAPILVRRRPGKHELAHAPSQPLPETITRRSKTGFTTPIDRWLQQQDELNAWQAHRRLRANNCPWARRWLHVVAQRLAVEGQ